MEPRAVQDTIEGFLGRIEDAGILDGPASALDDLARPALSDPDVRTALSGSWFGHPIHPPLTDVVIGSYTSAAILDLLPGRWSQRSADVLLATGLVASAPTVAAGVNDWLDTVGGARRVGVVHAFVNVLATILYLWSFVKRVRGQRFRGVLLGLAGLSTLTVGGTLGGHLAYRRGIGVDENAFEHFGPDEWTAAIDLEELPEGKLTAVTVDGHELAMLRVNGVVYAVANRCSHEGGPLADGHVHLPDRQVSCPWHHSTFSMVDGRVERGPASAPQPAYQTRVREGTVEVKRGS